MDDDSVAYRVLSIYRICGECVNPGLRIRRRGYGMRCVRGPDPCAGFSRLLSSARLADASARRSGLAFDRTAPGVIMGATNPLKRKKEEAAVTLTSVISAMGRSQDSNGRGLLKRAEYLGVRCRLPVSAGWGEGPPGARASCPRNAVVVFVGAPLVGARLVAVSGFPFVPSMSLCLRDEAGFRGFLPLSSRERGPGREVCGGRRGCF